MTLKVKTNEDIEHKNLTALHQYIHGASYSVRPPGMCLHILIYLNGTTTDVQNILCTLLKDLYLSANAVYFFVLIISTSTSPEPFTLFIPQPTTHLPTCILPPHRVSAVFHLLLFLLVSLNVWINKSQLRDRISL